MNVEETHEFSFKRVLGIAGLLVCDVLLALVTDVTFAFFLLLRTDLIFKLHEVLLAFLVILLNVL